MTATLPAPLSSALQESTKVAHDQAENANFVTRLMSGDGTALGLVALFRQSLPVYEALEKACRGAAADPRLAPLVDPVLERADALRADLAAWAPLLINQRGVFSNVRLDLLNLECRSIGLAEEV